MPRGPRLTEPGRPHHVIARGENRRFLFLDDRDRNRFLGRARRVFEEERVRTVAWTLMGNHVHLVLRPDGDQLSKAMQRVLGGYAQSFNRRYGRLGRLFGKPFFSRPVEDECDLALLVAYVLLNPLRAGIVRSIYSLRLYRWSSLDELLRPPAEAPTLVDVDLAVEPFGNTTAKAVEAMLALLSERYELDPDDRRRHVEEPRDVLEIGPRDRERLLVRGVTHADAAEPRLREALECRDAKVTRRLRLLQSGWDLDRVVRRAARFTGADVGRLAAGRRNRAESHARTLAAYFATAVLGETQIAVARATGVSAQAVSVARDRGRELATRLELDWSRFFQVDPDRPRAR